jgi:IS5 family transposase
VEGRGGRARWKGEVEGRGGRARWKGRGGRARWKGEVEGRGGRARWKGEVEEFKTQKRRNKIQNIPKRDISYRGIFRKNITVYNLYTLCLLCLPTVGNFWYTDSTRVIKYIY